MKQPYYYDPIINFLYTKVAGVGTARIIPPPEDFRMHYIQSGLAMAMYILGVPNCNLIAIGWWRSLRFIV